jgi:DNA-binding IscR family transcriptional regulator
LNHMVGHYLKEKQIDSFQKLRLLLFMYQHPEVKGSVRELADRLYLGDTPLLAAVLLELHKTGLLDRCEQGYRLRDEPDVIWFLQNLARAFEHPLSRVEILDQLGQTPQLAG